MLIFIFATVLPRVCLLKAVIPRTYAAGRLAERALRNVTEFAELFVALTRFLFALLFALLVTDLFADLDTLLLRVALSPQVPFAKQEFPTPILHSCQHFL